MKTIFIVNPKAGKGKKTQKLLEKIELFIKKTKGEAECYLTKAIGDAKRFVQEYGRSRGAARFIACGGDGTFSEVVNGAYQIPGAEVGVIPVGSGNDFVRNFPKETPFFDLALQMNSVSVPCDVIHYTTQVDGTTLEGVGANMFNIGFDCNVADKVTNIKNKTVFGGSLAYLASIFWNLVQKKTTSLLVEMDGVLKHDGKLLLSSVANGSYCGGGIQSNPMASLTDGKINVNLIQNISRMRFISLLPSYMKGTHMSLKGIEKIISCEYCKALTVTPREGNLRLCIDGEIITAGRTVFRILHEGIRFVLPGMVATESAEKEASFAVM